MKGFLEEWESFVSKSCDALSQTAHNTRLTLKYRNKPARGKLTLSNNNKVSKHTFILTQNIRYLFKSTNSIDKFDPFLKKYLHLLANKPYVEEATPVENNTEKDKKQAKKKGGKKK